MAGHGQKIDRKQEQAIAALLTCATITEAAKVVGVGERTILRWLQDPDFQEQYRQARQQVVRQAINRLQAAAGEAVDTLREIMLNPEAKDTARVRAALAVLETVVRVVENEDLKARIERLEEMLDQKEATRFA